MKKLLGLFIILFYIQSWAQVRDLETLTFSYSPTGQSLANFILQAESNFPVRIYFEESWIDTIRVRPAAGNGLLEILRATLEPSGFSFLVKDNHYVILFPDTDLLPQLNIDPNRSVTREVEWIEIGDQSKMQVDQESKVSGYVTDATGEAIPGVTVNVDQGFEGVVTNPLGHYELSLLPGKHTLTFRYLGFESEEKHIRLYSTGTLNINLYEETSFLEAVTIEDGSAQEKLTNTSMGKSDLSIYAINKMPAFLGEPDVIKSVTVLPGVSVTGESSSYISVRGGNYDQNLILMNDIPIYNPSHMLGFFSVFNPDFVSKVSLFKGSIPARYESRASSVLDVRLSPRASSPFMAFGGIGILTSSIGVKGELMDGKLSYAVGARKTYSDWILRTIPDQDARTSSANFSDINTLIRYQLNEKNTLNLTAYRSQDFFKFSADTLYSYNQEGVNFSWNHLVTDQLLNSFSISYSDYQYRSEGDALNFQYYLENGIKQYNVQDNLTYSFGDHSVEAGIHFGTYITSPGILGPNSEKSLVLTKSLVEETARTYAAYVEDEFKITENLRARAGLRFTQYALVGPLSTLVYGEGQSYEPENSIDTSFYGVGEVAASYQGWGPRASLNYIHPWASFKLGYNRMYQFQHLITNSISVTPLDQWKLSDPYIKPVISDQIALGIFKNYAEGMYELSAEGYIKRFGNLIEYKNGADIVLNENLEQMIISGLGKGWGGELLLSKNRGDTQGWISYTYSRVFIKTRGSTVNEQINGGDWYPYYTDRPHNISLSLDHKLTNRWSMGVNFKYLSGRPISTPSARYVIDNVSVAYFDQRNNDRIPDYHRMDLSLIHENKVRKNQRFRSKWAFSIYNLYFRKNAYSIFFKNNKGVPAQAYMLTVAGTAIPSITYKFEFN